MDKCTAPELIQEISANTTCITTEDSKKAYTACDFPFTYDGITHTECTYYGGYSKPWCGTKTDENGLYQSGHWGYCNMDKCTAPELIQEISANTTTSTTTKMPAPNSQCLGTIACTFKEINGFIEMGDGEHGTPRWFMVTWFKKMNRQCANYLKTSCHRRLKCEREVISGILQYVERWNLVRKYPALIDKFFNMIEMCGITPEPYPK